MTIVTSLRYCLLLAFFVTLYSTIINEQSGSEWFGLSIILYILVLLVLSFTKVKTVQPLVIYFIFLSIFWCLFRVIVLNFSVESVNYRYLLDFDHSDMAWTVLMISISSIFLVAGIVLGGLKRPPKVRFKVPLLSMGVNVKFFALYFLFLLVVVVVENELFRESGATKAVAVISFFLSTDSLIFLICSLFISRQDLSSRERHLLLLALFAYVFIRLLVGSKSGLYVVFLGLMVGMLSFDHLFKIRIKLIFLLFMLAPIGLIIFAVGTETRALSFELSKAGEFSNANLLNLIYEKRHIIWDSFDLQGFFNYFSRRISMFDYLNVLFNGETQTEHLGFLYGLKTLWNVITPSFIGFDDALIFQANLFKVAYGPETYQEKLTSYHSDMLPFFGSSYAAFGGFSLVLVSVFGYIFSRIYIIIDCCNFQENYFFKGLCIYFFGDFLFGMGVVSTIQQILFFTLFPLALYFLVQSTRDHWSRD